jgi:flagellar motor protein MotB
MVKLLFQSGSCQLVLKVASSQTIREVLAKNPEIAILIEGHTDDAL